MRRLSLIVGLVILAVTWLGPLPRMAQYSFSAHMAMHMSVVALATAYLAVGVAGGRFDLAQRYPRLVSPIPASILELVIVWAWHAPFLHHLARHTWYGFAVEQGMFLISGFLLWISALGGAPPRSGGRAGAGIVGLLLTSMHMTLLGALLALTPRPLFVHGMHGGLLSPLDDQHLGGAIMLFVGGVAYLAGALWLTADMLGRSSQSVEAAQ